MISGEKDEPQTVTRTGVAPQHQSDLIEKSLDSEISKLEIDPASSEEIEQFNALPVTKRPTKEVCHEEPEAVEGSVICNKLCANLGTDVKPSASCSPDDDHYATSITRANGDRSIHAAMASNAPPLLKHHLFRAPRPPRKSKSKLSGATSALLPTSKTTARKRKLDEIDQELRDILLEDPESCVLEGSIAKLVLERLGELDEVKVVRHDMPSWDDAWTELKDEKQEGDKDTLRSKNVVSLAPKFVSLRLYDCGYPESEHPLVRVTSGPHRGIVGSVFPLSVSAGTTSPNPSVTVQKDHVVGLTQKHRASTCVIDSKYLFVKALKECEIKDRGFNEVAIDRSLSSGCRRFGATVGDSLQEDNSVTLSAYEPDRFYNEDFAISFALHELSGMVTGDQGGP